MKKILTIILAFTTLFLSFPAGAQDLILPKGDFVSMRKTGLATVTEVVNPITVKLEDGRFIHLAGLDFPDLDYYDPGDLSVTAQEILDDFLKGRKVIIYQTKSAKKGRVNRMNHQIAHLVRAKDKTWTQGLMISLGVARVRTTNHNPEMASQMLKLENKARTDKAGLWGLNRFPILSPQNAHEKIGSYQIVEGTINSVSMHKNKVYLNFGNNWRDDFTVGISSTARRAFNKQKMEPRRWSGKRIRVRGWVESYNGPFIDIDHIERIELLFETSPTLDGSALPNQKAKVSPKKPKPKKKDTGSALPNLND